MNLTERQKDLLEKIVQCYIRTARPVSSRYLEKKFCFKICSATIRIDMQKLTKAGYLFQSHISGGRVPTDKGYRFFVDNFSEKIKRRTIIKKRLKENQKNRVKLVRVLAKKLADTSKLLSLAYLIKEDIFLTEGLEEVVRAPEFKTRNYFINFLHFLKDIEKNIGELGNKWEIKVYIGRENPFSRINDFSLISSKCFLPDNIETIFGLLGPKRMDYIRNIEIINSFTASFI